MGLIIFFSEGGGLDFRSDSLVTDMGYSLKSSQGLLFSEAQKPYAEAVGQTGAQGLVRGCGPHCPPGLSKESGER